MRVFIAISACTLAFASSASAENLVGDAVVLRTLDKVTATTQDYTVPVGEALDYGTLSIQVRHCESKPPEEIPETFAFLQIYDNKTDERESEAGNDAHAQIDTQQANTPMALNTSDEDMMSPDSQDKPQTYRTRHARQIEELPADVPAKIFSGWMLASNPAISPLDHPVYDVWVIGCNTR